MVIDARSIEVIDEQTAVVLRAKSSPERLRIANEMFLFAQRHIRAAVRHENPHWDEPRVRAEVARRIAGGPD